MRERAEGACKRQAERAVINVSGAWTTSPRPWPYWPGTSPAAVAALQSGAAHTDILCAALDAAAVIAERQGSRQRCRNVICQAVTGCHKEVQVQLFCIP